jgi:hypothetical protein
MKKISHKDLRVLRQDLIRQLKDADKKPVDLLDRFIPPVVHFVPRSVQLRLKRESSKVAQPIIVDTPQPNYQPDPRRRLRNRLNPRRRKTLKRNRTLQRWRESPDVDDRETIDTRVMIRRVNITALASVVDFVSSLTLTVVSLTEALKSLIQWAYYAFTSDDFGLLARITAIMSRQSASSGERLSQIFDSLRENDKYLFTVFMYVEMEVRRFRGKPIGDNSDFFSLLRHLRDREGIPYSAFTDEDVLIAIRDFEADRGIIDQILIHEREHFQNLLRRAVSKELTKIRGIRLFRNVIDTVNAIPIIRLATGISQLPETSLTIADTLRRLVTPSGSEVLSYDNTDEWFDFLRGISQNANLRALISEAENTLHRRRRRINNSGDIPSRNRFTEM